MSTSHGNAGDDISAQAAEWVGRCDAGLSASEVTQLAAWRAADPRHEREFGRFSAIWNDADRPRRAGATAMMHAQLAQRARVRRRRRTASLTAVVVLGFAAFWSARRFGAEQPAPAATAAVLAQTTLLGPERRDLPDGSIAEYPRGTQLTLDFSGTSRRVTFSRGEAHFKVAPDATRPFIVTAGGLVVRAVGTEFAVQVGAERTAVLVTEGKVAVNPATQPAAEAALAYVGAGQSVAVAREAEPAAPTVTELTRREIAQQLSWRRQRAEFAAVPLAQVVATVNRHNRIQFSIEDAALAKEPLSGVFYIDDAEEFAQLLEQGIGLVVERRSADRFALLGRR